MAALSCIGRCINRGCFLGHCNTILPVSRGVKVEFGCSGIIEEMVPHQLDVGWRECCIWVCWEGDLVCDAGEQLHEVGVIGGNAGGIVEVGDCADGLWYGVGCGVCTGIVLWGVLVTHLFVRQVVTYLCASSKRDIHRLYAIGTGKTGCERGQGYLGRIACPSGCNVVPDVVDVLADLAVELG